MNFSLWKKNNPIKPEMFYITFDSYYSNTSWIWTLSMLSGPGPALRPSWFKAWVPSPGSCKPLPVYFNFHSIRSFVILTLVSLLALTKPFFPIFCTVDFFFISMISIYFILYYIILFCIYFTSIFLDSVFLILICFFLSSFNIYPVSSLTSPYGLAEAFFSSSLSQIGPVRALPCPTYSYT